jgi:hypothetical protein
MDRLSEGCFVERETGLVEWECRRMWFVLWTRILECIESSLGRTVVSRGSFGVDASGRRGVERDVRTDGDRGCAVWNEGRNMGEGQDQRCKYESPRKTKVIASVKLQREHANTRNP